MNLSDLRPNQPTDLALLSESLHGSSTKAAMPSALPENFLLAVARDLRKLEESPEEQYESSYLAAPMMLIFYIHICSRTNKAEFTIRENALYRSLHIYQWAIEREIVKRIVGIGGSNDDTALLKKLKATRLESN